MSCTDVGSRLNSEVLEGSGPDGVMGRLIAGVCRTVAAPNMELSCDRLVRTGIPSPVVAVTTCELGVTFSVRDGNMAGPPCDRSAAPPP